MKHARGDASGESAARARQQAPRRNGAARGLSETAIAGKGHLASQQMAGGEFTGGRVAEAAGTGGNVAARPFTDGKVAGRNAKAQAQRASGANAARGKRAAGKIAAGRDAASAVAAARAGTAWRHAAAQLALAFPRARLEPSVVAWADASSRSATWGVAFSGGADSLALLLLLWAHWPERRARLRALHFDHRLRGTASARDAAFCRRVCADLGVRFVSQRWGKVPAAPSEAAARAARMDFFRAHARIVWFGHQQDDVAESVLMRLARGSGAGGLAAPRPVQRIGAHRVHLRPLLGLKKLDLVGALRALGVAWCEDATNAARDYFRNRIRHAVIPAWVEAAERDALAGAARSRALLEEDDAALEAWLAEVQPLATRGVLLTARLAGRPRALWRRALHRWLLAQPRAGELSRIAFETLLTAVERGADTRQSLGREGFAVLRRGELRFERGQSRRIGGRAN